MTTLSCDERDRLDAAAHEIAVTAGIDPTGARLLRYTMNAVFYLPAANVVLRIAPAERLEEVRQVAAVAARFAELDLPTVRLAPGFDEAIETPAWTATAWTYLPQPIGHRHQVAELAAPLQALHSTAGLGITVPDWNVIKRSEGRVRQMAALTGEPRDYLRSWASRELSMPIEQVTIRLLQRCHELRQSVAATRWGLPTSVIHGDAHAGNLLASPDGTVLIDLDSVRVGPPEWDLVPAAHGMTRFGDPAGAYADFVRAYGFDLLASPTWPVLRDVRELQLVTSVIASLSGRPDVAEELGHRLRSFFAGDSAIWHRFK